MVLECAALLSSVCGRDFFETETMPENDWHKVSFRHIAVPEIVAEETAILTC